MNDSLRTNLFVRFPPETIACACIFLAARELKVSACTCVIVPTDAELPEYASAPRLSLRSPCARVPHGGWSLTLTMRTLRCSYNHIHMYMYIP